MYVLFFQNIHISFVDLNELKASDMGIDFVSCNAVYSMDVGVGTATHQQFSIPNPYQALEYEVMILNSVILYTDI